MAARAKRAEEFGQGQLPLVAAPDGGGGGDAGRLDLVQGVEPPEGRAGGRVAQDRAVVQRQRHVAAAVDEAPGALLRRGHRLAARWIALGLEHAAQAMAHQQDLFGFEARVGLGAEHGPGLQPAGPPGLLGPGQAPAVVEPSQRLGPCRQGEHGDGHGHACGDEGGGEPFGGCSSGQDRLDLAVGVQAADADQQAGEEAERRRGGQEVGGQRRHQRQQELEPRAAVGQGLDQAQRLVQQQRRQDQTQADGGRRRQPAQEVSVELTAAEAPHLRSHGSMLTAGS